MFSFEDIINMIMIVAFSFLNGNSFSYPEQFDMCQSILLSWSWFVNDLVWRGLLILVQGFSKVCKGYLVWIETIKPLKTPVASEGSASHFIFSR